MLLVIDGRYHRGVKEIHSYHGASECASMHAGAILLGAKRYLRRSNICFEVIRGLLLMVELVGQKRRRSRILRLGHGYPARGIVTCSECGRYHSSKLDCRCVCLYEIHADI